ncbi:MAG: long-chain fatty acid--CoA ligase [Comamonadaceae bacterium]|nr:MAG: long-chain fatty acid--CoA ligase [Comamonadaceae bacterium]
MKLATATATATALPLSLHEAFSEACRRAPQHAFLAESALSGGRSWTFAQAEAVVGELAAHYQRQGWGAGHRVALAVGNQPRHFFHFLALNRLGASIVPLNPDHRASEIRHALTLARVDLVVAQPDRQAAIAEAVANSAALQAIPLVAVESLQADLPRAPRPAALDDDVFEREAAILFTSGTSGLAKACRLTNRYVMTAGAWYRDLGGHLHLRPGQERLLNPLPVFHMNCGMSSIAAICLTDNCLVLPDRFHTSTWWEDCVRSGATAIHYLGIMPPALFQHAPDEWESRHQVRFGLGAGCDPGLHPAFEQRFGFPLVEVWGMTETGRFLTNQHDPRQTDTRAFGRAASPLEVRVVDDEDRDVAPGHPGEMLVRATGSDPRLGFFSGYLDDEAATAQAWRGGWFHTGDVVTRDASGMLYFVDRRKDMIRRSGENISSGEVEAALSAHPSVHRVAVLSVPDEMRDEEVLAVIVLAAGVEASPETAGELVRYCLRELSYYKAPGWILFRDDLPVTATNKLVKNRIFGAEQDRRAGALDCRYLKKRVAPSQPTPSNRPAQVN